MCGEEEIECQNILPASHRLSVSKIVKRGKKRMKQIILWVALVCCLSLAAAAMAGAPQADDPAEILAIQAEDGTIITGKLRMPADGQASKLVIFVNGSGPNTFDNTRSLDGQNTFDYFDLFADSITADGAAFFSYNTRGVTPVDTPPLYAEIDDEAYAAYLPQNSISDVEAMITQLTARDDLKNARVLLLGWSEGAIIAPQVALRGNVPVEALLLAGYPNETMRDTLLWQQSGQASIIFYRQYFETDEQGNITEDAIAADPYGVAEALGVDFAALDMDKDGVVSAADFGLMLEKNRDAILRAIDEDDDAWLAANYGVHLTSGWFKAWDTYPPNSEIVPQLDLPIYIFQGEYDRNTPAEGAQAVAAAVAALGKDNLHVYIYEKADHDLNYLYYLLDRQIPVGIQAIFDTIKAL